MAAPPRLWPFRTVDRANSAARFGSPTRGGEANPPPSLSILRAVRRAHCADSATTPPHPAEPAGPQLCRRFSCVHLDARVARVLGDRGEDALERRVLEGAS